MLKIDYREQRARHFTHSIISLMREFLPRERECVRAMERHLYDLAYEQNLQIIMVPPEMDELTKVQLEQAMLKHALKVVMPDGEII